MSGHRELTYSDKNVLERISGFLGGKKKGSLYIKKLGKKSLVKLMDNLKINLLEAKKLKDALYQQIKKENPNLNIVEKHKLLLDKSNKEGVDKIPKDIMDSVKSSFDNLSKERIKELEDVKVSSQLENPEKQELKSIIKDTYNKLMKDLKINLLEAKKLKSAIFAQVKKDNPDLSLLEKHKLMLKNANKKFIDKIDEDIKKSSSSIYDKLSDKRKQEMSEINKLD